MNDYGEPVSVVYAQVASEANTEIVEVGTSWVVQTGGPQSTTVRIVLTRKDGMVRDLWLTPESSDGVHFTGSAAQALVALIRGLAFVPLHSDPDDSRRWSSRLDALGVVDIEGLAAAYSQEPELVRDLIQSDATAEDVIALAKRRQVVERFRRLMADDAYMKEESDRLNGPESVWQDLIERNPWLLGISLGAQLITAWNEDKLEQVVSGHSIANRGKRPDAVMKSAGQVQSFALTEIKRHDTPLLGSPYRPGVWGPSAELAGAIAQAQVTADLASRQIGQRLQATDPNGYDIPGEFTYLFRPRSLLIAGSLEQMRTPEGGDSLDRVRAFELFRRHLQNPEILTFDELLARAEFLVALAS